MGDRANPFEWAGGHPALDLINTLDERPFDQPVENLATYRDLVRFAQLAGLVDRTVAADLRTLTGPACSRVANRARELREHLHNVLAAAHQHRPVSQTDLDAIASAVEAAHAARVLRASPSRTLATYRWSGPKAIETPLHACALVIERLLRSPADQEMRRCRLRCVLHRQKQGAASAVVQHEQLRQPRKAEAMALWMSPRGRPED